jgi:hypothetical protein
MLRHSFRLAFQADTQPIAHFLANSGAANAVDVNIIPNSWVGHEIFLVGLAAVKTPGVQRDNCNEDQLFRSCSVVSPGTLAGTLCSNEVALLISQRLKHVKLRLLRLA